MPSYNMKSQLCHKAQTLAQMNAKLEAEILNIREDLFNQISTMKSSKDENDKLILEIHKEKVNIRFVLLLRRFGASTDQGHDDHVCITIFTAMIIFLF